MGNTMTFSAVGDSFITRRLPYKNEAFNTISSIIRRAEVRFTNLEVTTHNDEGFPSAFSGGTWAKAHPEVLKDLKEYGFNIVSTANNHTLDYSYGGLEATERYLNSNNLVHAGSGGNLAQASAPRYLDCPSGRVALIAATSTFNESWIAGEQRRDGIGRPGVNSLRYTTDYIVTQEELDQLKSIAKMVHINAESELLQKEGFAVGSAEGVFMFGKYRFREGTYTGCSITPWEKDVQRITNSILEAVRQADYVIVSIHSHEMEGEDKTQPAEFLVSFARLCIDAGAHAVIGHGPHILRGIEIYKKRPIFYSLGNFIFQSETVDTLPADFYEKYGLGNENNVADALDQRTSKDTIGLGAKPAVWESIIPLWSMEDGELKELQLYPIELGYGLPRYRRGWPSPAMDAVVLQRLRLLSEPFSTDIKIEGMIGNVNLLV